MNLCKPILTAFRPFGGEITSLDSRGGEQGEYYNPEPQNAPASNFEEDEIPF